MTSPNSVTKSPEALTVACFGAFVLLGYRVHKKNRTLARSLKKWQNGVIQKTDPIMPPKTRPGKRKPKAIKKLSIADQRSLARSLWQMGDTPEIIASKVGKSRRTIYRWIAEEEDADAAQIKKVDDNLAQLGEITKSVTDAVANAQETVNSADRTLSNVLDHYERVAEHLAELEDRRKQFEYRQQKISEAFLSYVARGIQSAQRYPDPFAHIKEMDALSRIHERVIRCYYGSKGALEGLGSMELDLSGVDEDTLLRLIQEQPRTKKQQDAEISQQQLDITAQEVV